jgi:hypothetical protein
VPDTFIKIASVTVGAGGASSIDFTSIPSTYTDLVCKVSARVGSTGFDYDWINMKLNSSTSGYTVRALYNGAGTVASFTTSGTATMQQISTVDTGNATANTFANLEFYIPNYAGSNNKSLSMDAVTETNSANGSNYLGAGLWSNSAAITSISIIGANASFVQYSTAVLYGIKNS